MKKYLTIGIGSAAIGLLIFFAPYKNTVLFGADSGFVLPTSGTNTGAGTAWNNPSNITVGTDAASAFSFTGTSSYLLGSSFGLSIPTGSTINGIQIQVRESDPDGGAAGMIVPFKAGVAAPTPIFAAPSSFNAVTDTYGTATSLWGTTWTASDINASNFGIGLQKDDGTSAQYTVYWIKVKIFYTPPVASGSSVVIQNATQVITNATMVIK